MYSRKLTSLVLLCALVLSHTTHGAVAAFAAPVASSFSTTVAANRQSILQLQGSDAEGTALTYATTSTPAHGTISNLNASTGALVYTPAPNYVGADSFTYTVSSGGDTSAPGTVTLSVTNAKTTISDSIVDSSGAGRNGKVTFILTQTVTTPTGIAPVGSSVSASVTSGNFSLQVYPSRSLSPAAYYQVWFADAANLKQELIGIYDIPLSTATVALAPYKVTDTNLAARYTFPSAAGLEALTAAVASASLSQLVGQSRTTSKLQYWNGSNLADSLVSQSGGTVTVSGNLAATSNATVGGSVTAGSYVGITSAAVPTTLDGKTLPNSALPSPAITGTVSGSSRVVIGDTTFNGPVTFNSTTNLNNGLTLNNSTFNNPVINTPAVSNPAITGGSTTGMTHTNSTLPSPGITGTVGGTSRTFSGDTNVNNLLATGLTLNGTAILTVAQSVNGRTGAVTLQSSDLNGLSGAGLSGIGTGTGGVTNTGSTTIGGDTDADDVGVVDLQTRGESRLQIRNDGFIQQPGPLSGSNLAAVVAAIGSAQKTLRIATPQTLSTSLTIPANVTLEFTDTGSITTNNGSVVLTIAQGSMLAPRRQIFYLPAGWRTRAVSLLAGGSGYTSAPTVSFTGGGCTSTPAATATIGSGAVQSITMTAGGAGCTSAPAVSFTGGGGTGASGVAQLGGVVEFTQGYPESFYPEWWGAAGNGSTDDIVAFNAMLLSMQQTVGTLPVGGRVTLQGGKIYKLSDTLHVRRNIHLTSSGGRDSAILKWAENKVGIVAHGLSTFSGAYAASNGRAQNALFENLTLSAEEGTTTNSTVTLNRWTVTRTAGTAFDQTTTIHDGNTIYINGRDWLIQSVDSGSQITLQNRQPIRLSAAGGTNTATNIGYQVTSPDMIGMNVSINREKRTISAVTPVGAGGTDYGYAAVLTFTGAPVPSIGLTAIGSGYTSAPACTISGGGGTGATCEATVNVGAGQVTGVTLTDEGYGYTSAPSVALTGGGGTGATAVLGALPAANVPAFSGTAYITRGFKSTLGSKAARQNIYHGLDLRVSATVRNVQINNFHGNGLNANSTQTPSFNSSVEPNANISLFERVWSDANSGNGYYLYGVNSNAGLTLGVSAQNNHGFGLYDNSFLGNTHIAPHLQSNHLGGYYSTQGGNNVSTFINPYAEGDEPANRFGRLTNMIGANLANGNDEEVEGTKKLGIGTSVDTWLTHGGVSRGNLGEPTLMLTSADTLGTASISHTHYLADTSGGAINYNLPTPQPENLGRRFYFKRRTGANNFTIYAPAGTTIDGGGTVNANSGVWILYAATNVWVTMP